MEIYKKEKYPSNILVDMTLKKEGFNPMFLKDKSNRYIWVSCRYCGEPNRVCKAKYYNAGNSNAHSDCRRKELSEVDSSFSKQEVQEKAKETILKKYGVDHNSKIKYIVEKRKKTFLNHFGVDNPSKSEIIKQKKGETCLKNYDVEYPLCSDKILSQSKKTLTKNYDVDIPAKSDIILMRMKTTLLKRYGVENPMQSETIKEKSKENFQEYISLNDDKYHLLNDLRKEDNMIWTELKELSLNEISKKYNIEYNKLRNCIYDNKDLYNKFKDIYSYPKNQKQNEIKKIIEGWGVNVVLNDRKVLDGLELDIYVPEKNFAIEFNGCFWHSEAWLDPKEAQSKHYNKTKLCNEKGIRLVHIFETEWEERKDLTLAYIKNILGLNSRKIFARKCKITHIECPDFFNKNHLQGSAKGILKYFNLEYNGEIVVSMTAGNHHEKNSRDKDFIVLSRFCSKIDCNVSGGASRLFECFMEWAKSQEYKKVISWSDSNISNGDVYGVLGFELEKEDRPDFKWWDTNINKMVTKQSRRHIGKAKPSEWKRMDWYASHGLFRIWNAGKKTWILPLGENKIVDIDKLYFVKNADKKQKEYIESIIRNIDDSYLSPVYRRIKQKSGINNMLYGHCYLVSEVLYHLLGGKDKGWVSKILSLELNGDKITHWWLENPVQSILIDATASQFDFNVDYSKGKGLAFLTKVPSKRAQRLLERIKKGIGGKVS